jgi:hypothetical protein
MWTGWCRMAQHQHSMAWPSMAWHMVVYLLSTVINAMRRQQYKRAGGDLPQLLASHCLEIAFSINRVRRNV